MLKSELEGLDHIGHKPYWPQQVYRLQQ